MEIVAFLDVSKGLGSNRNPSMLLANHRIIHQTIGSVVNKCSDSKENFVLNSGSIKNHHRQQNTVRLDDADLIILQELSKDARTPNNLLASRAGIAASTCLGRVRALQDAGVIRGFHADINPRMLGLQVTAMVSVMVRPDARNEMLEAARALQALPEVQDVFVLGGTPDILVHVICQSVEALRDFVAQHLGAKAAFASTQTNLVFEHLSPEG